MRDERGLANASIVALLAETRHFLVWQLERGGAQNLRDLSIRDIDLYMDARAPSLKAADKDFIVVDVRGPNSYAKGHVKGAINIPHREMTVARMAEYPQNKVFVVYCAGPHCNGANKAAVRLARLGLPVKMMIGGVTGWIDEGFTLTPSA